MKLWGCVVLLLLGLILYSVNQKDSDRHCDFLMERVCKDIVHATYKESCVKQSVATCKVFFEHQTLTKHFDPKFFWERLHHSGIYSLTSRFVPQRYNDERGRNPEPASRDEL